ncbi:MAG: protein kinase domain-containing protein [Vicinamibacterales bacterium]
MSLTAGTRLGPYEIVGPIGAGGMGDVYKARDTRLGRLVAIKVSKDHWSERFEREARAVAALNHPHICQLYDVGPNFLVMELVEGVPIRPPNTPQQLLDLAVQIADGLRAAHAAGVVHRDLKPGNILVTTSGQVKILDFGLAMMRPDSTEAASARPTEAVTAPGTTVGTTAYMSPEQARGETVDARSDLWSLGVVLYEMATRVRPFDGATTAVIFEALLTRSPVPVRERNPKVSPDLERIIGRLLEKDRETRYQSAADVHADLKRVGRDSSPSGVAIVTPRHEAQHPVRRRAVALIVLTLLLLAGGVGLFYLAKPAVPVTSPSEYTQLTNFTDSATAPSLSPDGRMVTFKRGEDSFLSGGQIYVKLLPNGEAVQLTTAAGRRFGPVFTPDGSRIAYTQVTSGSWDTWTVPVLGGQPTRLLPNASGLTWITDQGILFSEIKTGLHMGIVTATESRANSREIYFPANEHAMAHYSYASPDRQSVLVVEMDQTHAFHQPCRLLPFDGSSAGRQVGPQGTCTSAAWSPDGKWMYFGAVVDGSSHLWRQSFPDGAPEQITFGPTEEEGTALAPDGRSVVTSVGTRRSAIWIRDAAGERTIVSEGYAGAPRLSRDGTRVFYLLVRDWMLSAAGWVASSSELRSVDLASGKTNSVLPGVSVTDYDISRDEKEVAYTTTESGGESQIWVASLDRRTPPRQIARTGDQVSFGADGELIFRSLAENNVVVRIKKDGTGRERITTAPVMDKFGVSPDGQWVIVSSPGEGETPRIAVPIRGGTPRKICGAGCSAKWSSDGRFLYVTSAASASATSSGRTLAIPVPAGQSVPDLPTSGIDFAEAVVKLPGARMIEQGSLSPGPDPSTYVFTKTDLQRNLFRIPLH